MVFISTTTVFKISVTNSRMLVFSTKTLREPDGIMDTREGGKLPPQTNKLSLFIEESIDLDKPQRVKLSDNLLITLQELLKIMSELLIFHQSGKNSRTCSELMFITHKLSREAPTMSVECGILSRTQDQSETWELLLKDGLNLQRSNITKLLSKNS